MYYNMNNVFCVHNPMQLDHKFYQVLLLITHNFSFTSVIKFPFLAAIHKCIVNKKMFGKLCQGGLENIFQDIF